jgi:uncharacterized damage-inducible protein DinB
MTDLERAALLNIVAETPVRLRNALKGVSKKLLLWTPGPGKWSILEIVAHMRDMERDAYLGRYRRILAEENPALPDLDGDVIALRSDYRSMKLPEIVRDWTKLRKECLKLLKSVKGARWERMGTHETAGPLSMEDFLRRQAMGNDEAHLAQIEGIKRRATAFEALEAGPRKFLALTKKLDDAALRRKTLPDVWSAMEVACHLRDAERVWAERLVKTAFSEKPAFSMGDHESWPAQNTYNTQDLASCLKEFARLREDNLRLLRALPASQWGRLGVLPKRGEITIERMVEIMIEHDREHLAEAAKAAGVEAAATV